ncbi:hypothetical protein [Nocardioides marmoraquaticus]
MTDHPEAERSPLEQLLASLQAYANDQAGKPVLVDVALVVYEHIEVSDDGQVGRAIRYTVPTDNFSMTSCLGLLEAGGHYLKRDILCAQQDDDG